MPLTKKKVQHKKAYNKQGHVLEKVNGKWYRKKTGRRAKAHHYGEKDKPKKKSSRKKKSMMKKKKTMKKPKKMKRKMM